MSQKSITSFFSTKPANVASSTVIVATTVNKSKEATAIEEVKEAEETNDFSLAAKGDENLQPATVRNKRARTDEEDELDGPKDVHQDQQTKLNNFPSGAKSKRARTDQKEASPPKKEATSIKSAPTVLSPDQRQRMAANRLAALLKRLPANVALNSVGKSWLEALLPELQTPVFASLVAQVSNERASSTVYPPPEDVWTWTRHFAIQDTRVVVLGQDPYHGPGQAHGLCFSVKRPVAAPPSLINMFKVM